MTIEIAPLNYHKECSLPEAILYCFTLNIDGKIGWRLPTDEEYNDRQNFGLLGCWQQGDIGNPQFNYRTYTVAPVRDLT
jgi:hypothetical protein